VLPLSHDEVVHGKGSLLGKMAGKDWEQFANLRVMLGYMYGQAAKKLLFMGGELGQRAEWNHDQSLDWHLLGHDSHRGVQSFVRDLNHLYRREPALHELDCEPAGFEWVDCSDVEASLVSFLRRGTSTDDLILVVCNLTPVPRHNYRLGVPRGGLWRELLNSDAREYWGQGYGNLGGVEAAPFPSHGREFSVTLTLPPLAVVYLKSEKARQAADAPEAASAAAPEPAPAAHAARPHAEKPVSRRAPASTRKPGRGGR
jgi:1,4-alpha-glucan branching enzyme